MSANNDLPCTVVNMNHWIKLIHENRTFIQKLDEYQLSQTATHLKNLIDELQQELRLLKRSNPSESFSSPDLEKYLMVFELIDSHLHPQQIANEKKLPFDTAPNKLRIDKTKFDNIEIWLMDQKYLDSNGVWIKGKQDLAALLQFLIDKDIFGELRKDKRDFRTQVRREFEQRYKFESIAEQFKPSKVQPSLTQLLSTGLTPLINPVPL